MGRPPSRHPTELELEILKVIWRDGPANVRHVMEAIAKARKLAYTSVMTVMNIMVRKRYLARRKEGPGYVYRARLGQDKAARGMLDDLVDRVYDGSAMAVMLNLLETADVDAPELEKLVELINRKAKRRIE